MATIKQSQIIHILKQKLGFDDETYLQLLAGYGVRSSRDLTNRQASELIDRLNRENRHAHADGFATDKQVIAIRKLWAGCSNKQSDKGKNEALVAFISKRFYKTQIYDLTRDEASKVIRILTNWGKK